MIKEITVQELHRLLGKDPVILDIREPHELFTGFIPGAINIPMMTLALNHEDYMKPDQTIYIVCEHGVRSVQFIEVFASMYHNLINVTGGTEYYARFFPLEQLSHQGGHHGDSI
jgi:rhodanese-related sulfurtransferase